MCKLSTLGKKTFALDKLVSLQTHIFFFSVWLNNTQQQKTLHHHYNDDLKKSMDFCLQDIQYFVQFYLLLSKITQEIMCKVFILGEREKRYSHFKLGIFFLSVADTTQNFIIGLFCFYDYDLKKCMGFWILIKNIPLPFLNFSCGKLLTKKKKCKLSILGEKTFPLQTRIFFL